ncbi:hypothetical protein ACH427_04565 [Streptomyces sp. NPDC020379]|uniref:hypothetical protein n=1 Tax=Streptomyces sp. NPDC020379 TaxID=3365071 RepID=UPI00378BB044
METLVSIWVRNPKGPGWLKLGGGRMTIKTEHGLTEKIALKGLGAWLTAGLSQRTDPPVPWSPDDFIASAWFGDLGTLYADGNGIRKEKIIQD